MTTRHPSQFRAAALVLAAAGLLSACGGGGSSGVTSEVPDGASQTVAKFIEYLQQLVVAEADMLEPVDTSMVIAPTDETSEPTQVD